MKPPPDRLYGRRRTHALRDRQRRLLAETLPRIRLADPADPWSGFAARPQRLWLEIGFGGGEHARALTEADPALGLIACEVFDQGLCSMLAALVPEGGEATAPLPGNLRLWDGDARALLAELPPRCLDGAVLMFPDPWPKARHAKRRFVHPVVLDILAGRLRPGAEWRIASDDPTYQAWVAEIMGARADFAGAPPLGERPPGWPPTRYEAKARAAGRQPLYWSFRRV